MKKTLAAFAAGALACAAMLAPMALAPPAQAQAVYGAAQLEDANANAAAAARGEGVYYAQLTAAPAPIDGEAVVPWGQWLSDLIGGAFAIIFAALLWLMRKLPSNITAMVNGISQAMGQGSMNELLEKAVNYGVNVTKDAVRNQTMTIKVGNEVLERATEYAIRHAPGLVAKYGGLSTLREKIVARLELDADASVPAPRPPVQSLLQGDAPAPLPPPVSP
ncbi:MAG TPA: hypothetical protein PLS69_13405 [Terricaulis sp.]|nr:hypothetical protein [Terricaulis sp.]